MDSYHCRVLKPFDHYDQAGAIAVLSQNGFARMQANKFAGHVQVLAIEKANGDVLDPSGALVKSGKERLAKAYAGELDAIAIVSAARPSGEPEAVAREDKKSRTR